MHTTLDFFGLTDKQSDNISILIGGSDRLLIRLTELPADGIRSVVEWGDVKDIVIRWGAGHLEKILEEAQFIIGDEAVCSTIRLVGIIGNEAWSFAFIPKKFFGYNHETDDSGPIEFNPRTYHPGGSIVIPWHQAEAEESVRFIRSQYISHVPIYGEIEHFFLQFAMGASLGANPLWDPAVPTQQQTFDFNYTDEYGWPMDRFAYVPQVEVAKNLVRRVSELGMTSSGMVDPGLIAARLGIPIAYNDISVGARLIATQDGFSIDCSTKVVGAELGFDEVPLADLRQQVRFHELLISCRIAHELAHTFFFDWSTGHSAKPIRLNPQDRTTAEEIFCEVFSQELVSIGASPEDRELIRYCRVKATWEKYPELA